MINIILIPELKYFLELNLNIQYLFFIIFQFQILIIKLNILILFHFPNLNCYFLNKYMIQYLFKYIGFEKLKNFILKNNYIF